MRLNAKELVVFAKTCPRVDKRGYLYKRGVYNTQLRRRFFVLKGNLLFYYRQQEDEEPLGVIVLAGCTVDAGDRIPELGSYSFIIKFEFSTQPTRTFELAAESDKVMFDWIQAIQYANYEMLRIVVEDLKARVEAAETERALMANPRWSQPRSDGGAGTQDTGQATPQGEEQHGPPIGFQGESKGTGGRAHASSTTASRKGTGAEAQQHRAASSSSAPEPPAIPRPYHETLRKAPS